MPDDLAEWVWILKCYECSRVIGFNELYQPTRRLAEWATCCGEIMELESILRSEADA